MKQVSRIILTTSPPAQTGEKLPGMTVLKCRRRLSCGGMRRMPVFKERDAETWALPQLEYVSAWYTRRVLPLSSKPFIGAPRSKIA